MSGIATSVEQLLGVSRIPASAVKDDVPPFERYLAGVRAIGAQRPMQADHAAFERFMAEFHQAFPQATADQYVRAKHVAAAASGVLVRYEEKDRA